MYKHTFTQIHTYTYKYTYIDTERFGILRVNSGLNRGKW